MQRMLPLRETRKIILILSDGRPDSVPAAQYALRQARKQIAVVTLDEGRAELARAMLNLLSMDFRFTGENADFLRYGAFRRAWLRRTFLGTAFVLPVYRHKRLSDVRLDAKFLARWKAACGESVLDFGCGQGDEARMLRDAGIRVTEFEPYPADRNTVSREQGRASALGFLSAVRAGTEFSAIFVSSVLPFDVAVAFLVFMFLAVPARRKLLARLRQQLRPGGAIIVFDKAVPPGGYPATVLARLTWASKLDQGAEPGKNCRCRAFNARFIPERWGGCGGSIQVRRFRRLDYRRLKKGARNVSVSAHISASPFSSSVRPHTRCTTLAIFLSLVGTMWVPDRKSPLRISS